MEKENIENKEIKRFEAGVEAKLLKALSKIFLETNNTTEEDAVNNGSHKAVDPAHICMCIAKTEEAKRTISRFADKNNDLKVPNLDWRIKKEDIYKESGCNYDSEYLGNIYNVLKINGDHLKIWLKQDFPAKLENEHFEFLLAPRMESGDY